MGQRTFFLILISLTVHLKVTEGLLNCNITKNGDPTQFDVSQTTIDATQRENTTEGYQVILQIKQESHNYKIVKLLTCLDI